VRREGRSLPNWLSPLLAVILLHTLCSACCRPSTAFCRQLDAEEEYNDVDEVATGMMARWAGGDALPPRTTQASHAAGLTACIPSSWVQAFLETNSPYSAAQVLDDNVYERRVQQHTAAQPPEGASHGQQDSGMEVDAPTPEQSAAAPSPSAAIKAGSERWRSSLAGSGGGGGGGRGPQERRRVRFEGVAEPHVAPASCPGGVPPPRPRGSSLSRVPDHVQHPEKYTCYVLDEPLVVGGGVGQLAAGSQRNQRNAPPRAADEQEEEEEEARWQGPPGAVQFVSRQQRAGGAAPGGATASAPAAGAPAVARTSAAQQHAIVFLEEEHAGESAAMEDTPASGSAQAPGKRKRQYRRTSRAQEEDDDAT
jgi:hypothetical protein